MANTNGATVSPAQQRQSGGTDHSRAIGSNKAMQPAARRAKRAPLNVRQVLHLLHRAGILAAAIAYLVICIQAAVETMALLRDHDIPGEVNVQGVQRVMNSYIGNTTLYESPMVALVLQGDTSPRNDTLYLTAAGPNFTICDGVSAITRAIYSNAFLRSMYAAVARDTAYNITFLAATETELMMPVVDCLAVPVVLGQPTIGKFFFLVRKKANPTDVYLVTLALSNQEYRIDAQSERGSAGVGSMSFINDLRAPSFKPFYVISLGYPYAAFNFRPCTALDHTPDNQLELEIVPDVESGEIPKTLSTAFRTGFYMKSPTEQVNVRNLVRVTATTPRDEITQWITLSKPVLHDSWGWVHGVQVLLAIDLFLNLVILLIVVARNIQAGKLWIGDAFVSISTTILTRSMLVLASWGLSGFWSIYEFCLRDAYVFINLDMTVYDAITRADILCLYLSLCGALGILFRERVDPLVAMVSFAIGYELRQRLAHMFPNTLQAMVQHATEVYRAGRTPSLEGQAEITPMLFFNVHLLANAKVAFPFRVLTPVFSTLVLVFAYIVCCKVYRRVVPETTRIHRTTNTGASGGEDVVLTQKRVLTLFEVATGAELEARFGLLSAYEKHLVIKGMKFASADGIYSNGFVIANNKFLLEASDYWHIVIMKLTRTRYKSVFVYEIAGSTVQQTAKLVYPHTFSFTDLVTLNISVLS